MVVIVQEVLQMNSAFEKDFYIQDVLFSYNNTNYNDVLTVNSKPRRYDIIFKESESFSWLNQINNVNNFLLIDKNVKKILNDLSYKFNIPTYEIEATEDNKNITKVLEVCEWFQEHKVNRGSMVYVLGGGILQDIGAFSCYMFKRGVPWTFIPTTLLAQADSCLGAKTAVNFKDSKNVLGLFSAPRKVIVDTKFLETLNMNDTSSGIGEIFRLCITGGWNSFNYLRSKSLMLDLNDLIKASLLVKKLIVDYDEYELDIRRSMNYGHSIGHAIEAYTHYKIPHGQAVALGILVENYISHNRNMLPLSELKDIFEVCDFVTEESWQHFFNVDSNKLLQFLTSDKKVVGKQLKLATIESIGKMKFIDLPLDNNGMAEVYKAFEDVKNYYEHSCTWK